MLNAPVALNVAGVHWALRRRPVPLLVLVLQLTNHIDQRVGEAEQFKEDEHQRQFDQREDLPEKGKQAIGEAWLRQ
ncbi:hypothetical protein TYRP_006888 [Tyrophagus putrescentiae]|nr:hypothetical protein TYRP_006888 [Tyrophagus putrescentiae]